MINYCTLIENDLSLVLSELGTQDLKRNAQRSFQATHVPAAMLPSVQPRHFGDRRVRAVDLGRLLTTNYAPPPPIQQDRLVNVRQLVLPRQPLAVRRKAHAVRRVAISAS